MKYQKPIIISQSVLEKTCLSCNDYTYYAKDKVPCYEEYIGGGKDNITCFSLNS